MAKGESAMKIVKSAPSAPIEVRRQALEQLIKKGIEPSPENLLKDARKKSHPLHAFFYDTPDEMWIQFGRYEAARRIIDTTKVEFTHGGKTMQVRAVEFVKVNGHGKWATTEDIVKDPELLDAYMLEIGRLNEQAAEKMARLRALMAG